MPGNETLVDLARENHRCNLCRLCVGDAESVFKFAFDIHSLEGLGQSGSAAVNENDLDSDEVEERNVAHNGFLEAFVDH